MDQYMAPVAVGDVMRGGTIGVVEESRADGLAPGDIVQGFWGWQDYAAIEAASLRAKLPADDDVPLVAYMGLLGAIGCTAYFGLLDIGQPKPGETVVVTAAAGAVGSVVGQIAKIKGCRVVGIAGGPEKCAWIKDTLGFDAGDRLPRRGRADRARRRLSRRHRRGVRKRRRRPARRQSRAGQPQRPPSRCAA